MAMPTDKAMHMVPRKEWDAIVPRYRFKADVPVDTIILRYTNTDPCTTEESCCEKVRSIQQRHIEDYQYADIMYNFLIGGDGRVYEGSGWIHTTNKEKQYCEYDFANIDVAYIAKNDDDVTPDMRWAVRKLLEHGKSLDVIKEEAKLVGESTAIEKLYT